MFGPPGHAYVYFTYGMHWMMNVITEMEGSPAAVLLRAIQPLEGIQRMRELRQLRGKVRKEQDLTSGPARLTQALAIDDAFNGTDVVTGQTLRLEPGTSFPDSAVQHGPRVGINYADEKDRLAPRRFWVKEKTHVSRRQIEKVF